jgi:RNA polymerase sigma-70 factor (ECF subfamily)
LPEALRIVVLLVDVEEMSYAEAAEALHVPVGTIRSRLSRARYMLQDLLREYAKERRLI